MAHDRGRASAPALGGREAQHAHSRHRSQLAVATAPISRVPRRPRARHRRPSTNSSAAFAGAIDHGALPIATSRLTAKPSSGSAEVAPTAPGLAGAGCGAARASRFSLGALERDLPRALRAGRAATFGAASRGRAKNPALAITPPSPHSLRARAGAPARGRRERTIRPFDEHVDEVRPTMSSSR